MCVCLKGMLSRCIKCGKVSVPQWRNAGGRQKGLEKYRFDRDGWTGSRCLLGTCDRFMLNDTGDVANN